MDDSTMTENSDEMEYEEEDEDDNDYYYNYDHYADSGGDGQTDPGDTGPGGNDFETLQGLECLNVEQAKNLLNEHVDSLSCKLHISPSLAKLFLHLSEWSVTAIVQSYMKDTNAFLVQNRVKPASSTLSPSDILALPSTSSALAGASKSVCPVCTNSVAADQFHALTCGHAFCRHCWAKHFEVQINQGITLDISCMASDCKILAPETLILTLLPPKFHDRYESFSFRDFVSTHPCLRFCPGLKCNMVMKARESKPKRATCTACHTSFCFKCGVEYHAPTDCAVIKKWLTKCADDSETANYISAHTKDCPKCHICIEKNGGCNHMQCYHCKHEFCWMCLGDWKQHGSEYYECSRYRENPNIGRESALAQAREALKKYLHYYERWENHAKSLKLESALVEKIRTRIASKVMTSSGTWIDWQYLMDAATLLTRCRYTLQYTYPYAYYMQSSSSHSRKELFEYQQAQLEAEIENLSWKVERAETFDRGNLENQMDIAEKRRLTLLKDFHLTSPPSPSKDVPSPGSNSPNPSSLSSKEASSKDVPSPGSNSPNPSSLSSKEASTKDGSIFSTSNISKEAFLSKGTSSFSSASLSNVRESSQSTSKDSRDVGSKDSKESKTKIKDTKDGKFS